MGYSLIIISGCTTLAALIAFFTQDNTRSGFDGALFLMYFGQPALLVACLMAIYSFIGLFYAHMRQECIVSFLLTLPMIAYGLYLAANHLL